MGELGNRLREARERLGLDLDQVEASTRIRRVFLEALEEERFDVLPADVYARGFLQNYARFLGLDPKEILAAYRAAKGGKAAPMPTVLSEPLVRGPGSAVWPAVFMALMALAVLALAGWYAYNRFYLGQDPWPRRITPEATGPTATRSVITFAPSPQPTVAEATPSPTPSAEATATPTAPAELSTATPEPSPTPTVLYTPTQRATAIRQPTNTLASTATVSATPIPEGAIRVEARVVAKSYLLVTIDGQRVYEGILDAGDSRVWVAQRTLAMRVGNAAGVKLVVNGVEVASLGASGQVVDVTYTLENLPKP